MTRLTHAALMALLAFSTPALASQPGEDKGPAPQPTPGTGAGAALATGMVVATPGAAKGVMMNYQLFEATVPHVDLTDCPIPLLGEGRFCRLGLSEENVIVYVFSDEGDQPLIDARTWPADTILPLLN